MGCVVVLLSGVEIVVVGAASGSMNRNASGAISTVSPPIRRLTSTSPAFATRGKVTNR